MTQERTGRPLYGRGVTGQHHPYREQSRRPHYYYYYYYYYFIVPVEEFQTFLNMRCFLNEIRRKSRKDKAGYKKKQE
jgi:hypothetical protein